MTTTEERQVWVYPTTESLLEEHVFDPYARNEIVLRLKTMREQMENLRKDLMASRAALEQGKAKCKQLQRERMALALCAAGCFVFAMLR